MIKKFRPTWSLDIEKTEKWLSEMAARGYHLQKINFFTATFTFQPGPPQEAIYQVTCEKDRERALPQTLVDDGWHQVFHHGKWRVLANSKPLEQIKTFPSREGLYKRNRLLMLVLGGISLYHLFSTLIILTIPLSISLVGGQVTVVPSPYWIITPFLWAPVIFVFYCLIKLIITNSRLYASHEKVQTAALPGKGKLATKWKFAWQYSPDKLEQWLEQMELKGFNLYRVGFAGVRFLFARGSRRRVKYCVDYQNTSDQGYFDIHRADGWKPVYTTSLGGLTRWTIWSQEYREGEDPPQMYSDREHLLIHARRIAVTHSCLFLPLIALYIWNLYLMVERLRQSPAYNHGWFSFTVFAVGILVFGILTIKTWMYYRRLKKQTTKHLG